MAYVPWNANIQTDTGDVVESASIEVRTTAGGTALATLYSDAAGTAETNPFTTGVDGFAQFWVAPGQYTIAATASGSTQTWTEDLASISAIDDAVIGGVTPSTGAFTAITASGDLALTDSPLAKVYSSDATGGIQLSTDALSNGPYIIQYGASHAVLPGVTVMESDKFHIRNTDGATYYITAQSAGVTIGSEVIATEALDVVSDAIRIRTSQTPASATATGNAGTICWDASYIYVCTATDTWKRSAIATW